MEFIDRDICTYLFGEYSDYNFVIFNFAIPFEKLKKGYDFYILEWKYKLMTELSEYIKRCESYGFECRIEQRVYNGTWIEKSELNLYVGHKGFSNNLQNKKIKISDYSIKFIGNLMNIEDALSYTKSELDAWEESWRNR